MMTRIFSGLQVFLTLMFLTTMVSKADDILVLDDGESDIQWSCKATKIFKTPDASQGKSAIGVEVNKPIKIKLDFDRFIKGNIDLSEYDLLSFDYKLSGPVDYVNLVIRQHPLNAGRRGQYYPLDQADISGKWETKVLPLRGPENLSLKPGERWDPKAREFYFEFTPRPGMEPARLLLDNIKVMKNPVNLPTITFGDWQRLPDNSVVYNYTIPLVNNQKKPVTIDLNLKRGQLKEFKVKADKTHVTIPPGGEKTFKVAITIPAKAMKKLSPYYGEEVIVSLSLADTNVILETRLIAAVPPAKFKHPALVGSLEQLQNLQERAKKYPELQKIWKNILLKADEELKNPTTVPEYGGNGGHANPGCPEDGTRLQLLKPRAGILFSEYLCPKCGRVFSGKAFDNIASRAGEWHSPNGHMGLSWKALYCAFAYRVTGDKRYAQRVAEIFKDYGDKYFTYDEVFFDDIRYPLGSESPSSRRIGGIHFVENQWLQNMVTAFDLIRDTEVLDKSTTQAFKKVALYSARRSSSFECGYNNIQLMGSISQIAAGYALEDPVVVYFGLYEKRGAVQNLKYNILADGTWGESASYNSMVGGMLPTVLYLAKQLGVDLYTPQNVKFFTQWPKAASPEGKQPYFGDGPGGSLNQWGRFTVLPYYQTKKPELGAVLNRYPGQIPRNYASLLFLSAYNGPVPTSNQSDKKRESILFEEAGYAFLNNSNNLWLALVYGPHLGHGHFDRLGFEFYGAGALQVIDGGACGYRSRAYSEFQRFSLAHNTITVDGENHHPAPATLLQFNPKGEVKLLAVGSEQLADGVWMKRNVAMFSDALLLIDSVKSNKEHVYDWLCHIAGEAVESPTLTPVKPLAESGMYSYLNSPATVAFNGKQVNIIFRQGKQKNEKLGSGLSFTQIVVPDETLYLAKSNLGCRKGSTIMSRRKAFDTVFVSLLEPLTSSQQNTYKLGDIKQNKNKVLVTVIKGGNSWLVEVTLGDFKGEKLKVIPQKGE
jgi:hypothetical protein